MSFKQLTLGDKAPTIINTVIEIPKGGHNKYEYDERLDIIRLDRVLYSAVFYPADYGFVPQTRGEDGDHLDILVLISEPLFTGCLLETRPIGVLTMEDEMGKDIKIISAACNDPRFNKVQDIKNLEGKIVKVHRWLGKEEACKIIEKAKESFQKGHTKSSETLYSSLLA